MNKTRKPRTAEEKQKASRVGKASRNKGARGELWLARELTRATGVKFRRTPQSGGSALAVDFDLAGDVSPPPDAEWRFCHEMKWVEGWTLDSFFDEKSCLWGWWFQASRQADSVGKLPVLVVKRNRHRAFAIMSAADFEALYSLVAQFPKCATNVLNTYGVMAIRKTQAKDGVQYPVHLIVLDFYFWLDFAVALQGVSSLPEEHGSWGGTLGEGTIVRDPATN